MYKQDAYKKIPVKTTYLEMLEAPEFMEISFKNKLHIEHLEKPDSSTYLSIYKEIGGPWGWAGRLIMSEEELLKIIQNDLVEIYFLYDGDIAIGLCELNRRKEAEVQLHYFGLATNYVGKGLGKVFMNWTIQKAWSYNPKRFWLHTCEYDHPRALEFYQKSGFKIYEQKTQYEYFPEDFLKT